MLECPCGVDCPGGCEKCDHSLCETTTIAATTIATPSKEAVLLLATRFSSNVPMVIDFEGLLNKLMPVI